MEFDFLLNAFPVRDSQGNILFTVNLDGSITFYKAGANAKVRSNATSGTLEVYDGANWHTVKRGQSDHDVAVASAATTLPVTFATQEPDANYAVSATPNWGTTVFVTNKLATGFTLNFGTAAPAAQTVDWSISR